MENTKTNQITPTHKPFYAQKYPRTLPEREREREMPDQKLKGKPASVRRLIRSRSGAFRHLPSVADQVRHNRPRASLSILRTATSWLLLIICIQAGGTAAAEGKQKFCISPTEEKRTKLEELESLSLSLHMINHKYFAVLNYLLSVCVYPAAGQG